MLGSLRAAVNCALNSVLVVLELRTPDRVCNVVSAYLDSFCQRYSSALGPRIETACRNQSIAHMAELMPNDGVCPVQFGRSQLVREAHVAIAWFDEGDTESTRLVEVRVVTKVMTHVEWLPGLFLRLRDA